MTATVRAARQATLFLLGSLLMTPPALAQARRAQPAEVEALPMPSANTQESAVEAGHVARSAAGEVGRRQQPDAISHDAVNPFGRVNQRVENRVELRLYNRVDRFYDPRVGVTLAYRRAEREVRAGAGRRPRR